QQVAVERVDEAVVVVDDENAGHVFTVTSLTLIHSLSQGKTNSTSTSSTIANSTISCTMRHHTGPGRMRQRAAYIALSSRLHGYRDLGGRTRGCRLPRIEHRVADDSFGGREHRVTAGHGHDAVGGCNAGVLRHRVDDADTGGPHVLEPPEVVGEVAVGGLHVDLVADP